MFKFAFRNLLSRPLRSLLSLLGLTVAIIGMVGLFSVARGIDQTLKSTFGRIPGLLAVQPGAPLPLFSRMPAGWEAEIAAVEGVKTVNAEVWQRANMINGKMILAPPRLLFGTDIKTRLELNFDPYREDMLPGEGRYFTLDDIGSRNTVISKQIADEFKVGVGDTLTINGFELSIVGIYHCGSLLLDVTILLDIDQLRAMSRFDPKSVSAYYIEQTGEIDDEPLIESIKNLFLDRSLDPWQPSASLSETRPESGILGGLLKFMIGSSNSTAPAEREGTSTNQGTSDGRPARVDTVRSPAELPIEVRNAMEWAERFEGLNDDLNLFLGVMTAIGVTIAVLSIINTMLMSVTERFIEFGVLKANGWSRADVMKLITCESATLGFSGGLLGTSLGWVAVQIINAYWPDRVQLYASPGLLAFSVCFATALGMLGGLYPALWAMRMSPMDAIRRG